MATSNQQQSAEQEKDADSRKGRKSEEGRSPPKWQKKMMKNTKSLEVSRGGSRSG
jgi:hypothetical protein